MDNTEPKFSDIIFYTSPKGNVSIEVIFNDETFWLNQKRMSELFGVDVRTVNEHLQNIFKTNELQKDSTIRKIRIVQKEGLRDVSRDIDAIDSISLLISSDVAAISSVSYCQ